MEKFINEYEFNLDIIKETRGAWWNYKFRKSIIISITLFGMMIGKFLITIDFRRLILAVFCLLPLVILTIKKKIAIQKELKKLEEVYKQENVMVQICIGETVNIVTPQNKQDIEFNLIQSYIETKNLIILMVGNRTIALHKNGFTKGTYEDFLSYMKERILK